MGIAVGVLFAIFVLSGLLAWLFSINMGTIFVTLSLLAIAYSIYFLATIPLRDRKAKRKRAARAVALSKDGFTITYKVERGDTDLVFDSGRREWALIDANRTERFRYDQFDAYDVRHDPNHPSVYKLECTIKTLDPNRPLYKWRSIGQYSDGEMWAQKMVAIMHS